MCFSLLQAFSDSVASDRCPAAAHTLSKPQLCCAVPSSCARDRGMSYTTWSTACLVYSVGALVNFLASLVVQERSARCSCAVYHHACGYAREFLGGHVYGGIGWILRLEQMCQPISYLYYVQRSTLSETINKSSQTTPNHHVYKPGHFLFFTLHYFENTRR